MSYKYKICIFGIGYVGEPLLLAFSKFFLVIGYDINRNKINLLKKRYNKNKNIIITDKINDTKDADIYIVTVPTPIYKNKIPDVRLIKKACKQIGKNLNQNNIVIFESTVYPGFTEHICVPILEKESNLKLNKDFYCGYSPERINPGDKKYNLQNIVKLTSGSNKYSAKKIDDLYKMIINAGTYLVDSIKIAEAAKVIENTQRDLNIAYVNELSIIFNKLNLDTTKILKAASTKWNFLNFSPGLVGGHCIGVDPYYLTYISQKVNYKPKVLLAGRELNDSMPKIIFKRLLKKIQKEKLANKNLKLLFMGSSFKENSDDLRNSKIFEVIDNFDKFTKKIDIFEPNIKKYQWLKNYNFVTFPKINNYHCIVISVAHNYFKKIGFKKIKSFGKKNVIIFDIKNMFDEKSNLNL